ncbi:hypothetical protein Tco_1337696 [Tanacetum coccineum]
MNQNYFNYNYSGFDQPPQYSINHQEDLNQQGISDVHDKWDKLEESQNELLKMIQLFCEKFLQQKQAASIDQSPLQEMSIQDIEDLKQHYLDEMLSLSNDLQIKDYRNEKIDIRFGRECKSMIDELKENIESKDSYVSNLDESVLLVTPLSDFNEDECFDPGGDVDEIEFLLRRDPSTPKMSVVSILEGFTNEPPLKENDDLFDLKSKANDWKKILCDAPIKDLMTEDKDCPDFEDSRAHGFVHRLLNLQSFECLYIGI